MMKIKQVEDNEVMDLLYKGKNVIEVNRNGQTWRLNSQAVSNIRDDINSGKYAFFIVKEDKE